MKKITRDYLQPYDKVILTQPLNKGYYVQQIFTRDGRTNRWEMKWDSNYVSHICPYDGSFRKCDDCGALDSDFSIDYCLNKIKVVNTKEVTDRVNDCLAIDLKVEFIERED